MAELDAEMMEGKVLLDDKANGQAMDGQSGPFPS